MTPSPPFAKGGVHSGDADGDAGLPHFESGLAGTGGFSPNSQKRGSEGGFEEVWTGDYVFENEWQSFRTKKDRSLELVSVAQEVMPGRRKVAVKVVDIFGNGTMTIVEVSV